MSLTANYKEEQIRFSAKCPFYGYRYKTENIAIESRTIVVVSTTHRHVDVELAKCSCDCL